MFSMWAEYVWGKVSLFNYLLCSVDENIIAYWVKCSNMGISVKTLTQLVCFKLFWIELMDAPVKNLNKVAKGFTNNIDSQNQHHDTL